MNFSFGPSAQPAFGEWNFLPIFRVLPLCIKFALARPPHSVVRRRRRGHRKLTLKLPDAMHSAVSVGLAGDGGGGCPLFGEDPWEKSYGFILRDSRAAV